MVNSVAPFDAEMLHHRVEGFLADLSRAEELLAIVDHRRLVGCRIRQILPVPQGVDDCIAQSGATSRRRVGVPDELAVVLPGRYQHRQLPDAGRQRGVSPQVQRQPEGALRYFRCVEDHRPRPGGGHFAPVGDEGIEGVAFVFLH